MICADGVTAASGFAGADDLGSGSLAERAAGCRSATASEVAVRAETLSPDGFPVATATATSDATGTVLLTVPVGQGSTAVRLTVLSPASDATTTVTLSPGQTRSLMLTLPDPTPAVGRTIDRIAADPGGWIGLAAGGPETTDPSPMNLTGWFAVAGAVLVALGMGLPMLRRRS